MKLLRALSKQLPNYEVSDGDGAEAANERPPHY